MNVDDFTKLLLAIAVAFAIVILAWGLFRILNNLAGSIGDLRKAIKNTSTLSDYVLEDYLKGRQEVYGILRSLHDFKSSFVDPVRNIAKIAGMVNSFKKRSSRDSQGQE